MPIVYLNSEYLPQEKATVSVEDRGFLFAEGIYEVARAYAGRLFRWEDHMERLRASLEAMRIPPPAALEGLRAITERLLAENNEQDSNVYIQVTRGPAHPRTHTFPEQVHPTLLVMLTPAHGPSAEVRAQGVSAMTLPDLRWLRCDVKSTMLMPNTLAKQLARESGAFEAILVRDGIVTEGSSTNIFAVIGGRLRTHPADQLILPGVSRQVVLERAAAAHLPCYEESFTLQQLYSAEEVFLSSTTAEVLAITQIDGRAVASGRPGPLTLRLADEFRRYVLSQS